MKKTLLMMAIVGLGLTAMAIEKDEVKLKVNTETSTFKWNGKKVGGEHFGTVKYNEGTVIISGKKLISAAISMDMSSLVSTDLSGEWKDKLEGHLKSEDFFNTSAFPSAQLIIKQADEIKGAKAGANNYNIVANLTIKGITNEIRFPAMIIIKADEVIANADLSIDRTLYGIKYGSGKFFEGLGDKMIEDLFLIKVRVVANK